MLYIGLLYCNKRLYNLNVVSGSSLDNDLYKISISLSIFLFLCRLLEIIIPDCLYPKSKALLKYLNDKSLFV